MGGPMGTFKNGIHLEVKPSRFARVLHNAALEKRPLMAEIRHNGFAAASALYLAISLGTVRVLDETTDLLTAINLTKAWPKTGHLMLAIWPTMRLDSHSFLSACSEDLITLQWRERHGGGGT